jgi:anti-anti-sigma factor
VDVFERAIRPHCVKGRKLVVDCSGLTNFNSVCLTFLNTYCQETYRLGGRVAFCSVPPKMEEIIRLLGLHRVLPMYRTLEEAVAFLEDKFVPAPSPRPSFAVGALGRRWLPAHRERESEQTVDAVGDRGRSSRGFNTADLTAVGYSTSLIFPSAPPCRG